MGFSHLQSLIFTYSADDLRPLMGNFNICTFWSSLYFPSLPSFTVFVLQRAAQCSCYSVLLSASIREHQTTEKPLLCTQ